MICRVCESTIRLPLWAKWQGGRVSTPAKRPISYCEMGWSTTQRVFERDALRVAVPGRTVLDTWRADYNGVRPHSAVANGTLPLRPTPATVKTSTQDSTP